MGKGRGREVGLADPVPGGRESLQVLRAGLALKSAWAAAAPGRSWTSLWPEHSGLADGLHWHGISAASCERRLRL